MYDPNRKVWRYVDPGPRLPCCANAGVDAAELSLNGQEKMGTTWSICKMNMRWVASSRTPDIPGNADTLVDPQHKDDNNELRRFDRGPC